MRGRSGGTPLRPPPIRTIIVRMERDDGPILDMTPEGEFTRARDYGARGRRYYHTVTPSASSLALIIVRLIGIVALIAVGVLAFWFAIFTLPFVFLCGVIIYGLYRFQASRAGKRYRPVPPQRNWQRQGWRNR